jgi:NTE family protein
VGHCIAHVGVLKALHRAGISIHSVAGTSGGALVAGLFCAERNVADLEEAVRRIGWKRLAGLTLFASKGLATSEPIARFVSRMIAPRTRFSEMAVPLAVTATDLLTGETVIFRDDACPVPEAVRISCTIPLVYAPVVREGRLLVDGGVSDPLPVDAARSLGPDVVVAISLKHRPRELRNLLEVGVQMLDVTTASLVAMAREHADFALEVDVGATDKWDLKQAERLIALGEAACERALPGLLALLRYRGSFEYRRLWSPLMKRLGSKAK